MLARAKITRKISSRVFLGWRHPATAIALLTLSTTLAGCGTTAKSASQVPTSHPTAHGHGKSGKHHTKHSGHGTPMVIAQVTSSTISLDQGTHHTQVSTRVPTYVAGGYVLSQKGWLRAGEIVKLVRQGKTVTGIELTPVAEGTVSNISGAIIVVKTKTGSLTVTNGMAIPTLGLSSLTTGSKVMLFGPSKTTILGVAGIPVIRRLVMVAANSATDTVTVETSTGTTITVPFDGPLHRLQHLTLGHQVQVYQAPDGKWISAR